MATRDLTAHFMQLRALYSKPQGHGFDDDDFYDDELAHFNAQAFGRDKELTRSASAQSEWIQLIHEMRELVASLNKKRSHNCTATRPNNHHHLLLLLFFWNSAQTGGHASGALDTAFWKGSATGRAAN